MKEFDINITETLEKTVTVAAETREEAEEKCSRHITIPSISWIPKTLPV